MPKGKLMEENNSENSTSISRNSSLLEDCMVCWHMDESIVGCFSLTPCGDCFSVYVCSCVTIFVIVCFAGFEAEFNLDH